MLPELDEEWCGEDSVAYRQGEGNGIAGLGVILMVLALTFTVWVLTMGGCS